MPISIPAFLSYLLLIGSARAQVRVNAPNCTDSTFAWVGSFRPDARFVSITIHFSHRVGVFIVVQFAPTKSLPGHSVPGGDVQQRRSVDALFGASHTILSACAVFFVPTLLPGLSYAGPTASDADKGNICKCNTVVYNLISACDACQGESWTPCVDQLVFARIPTDRPTCLTSYSSWSFNCTTKASPGT